MSAGNVTPHLLIDGAGGPAGALLPAHAPTLARILRDRMAPIQSERVEVAEDGPSTPAEIALARALGLHDTPGRIPWTAWDTKTAGTPCALLHLVHWQVGRGDVTPLPPAALGVEAHESDGLREAATPYFTEDGIALAPMPDHPGVWFATGEPLRDLECVSLARAVGRPLEGLGSRKDRGSPAALMRRLQNEMQMLFYTHEVTDERARLGRLPINSFWITGAGALDALPPVRPGVRLDTRLRDASMRGNDAAVQAAWRAIDAEFAPPLADAMASGIDARVTFCGDHAAQTHGKIETGAFRRFLNRIGKEPRSYGLEQL